MFWDSSALVPLLLPEAFSAPMASLLRGDPRPTIWWCTPVECHSAIQRRHRDEPVPAAFQSRALDRLHALQADIDTIVCSTDVQRLAGRLLAVHPLRSGGALQLAAALVWTEEQPAAEPFVSLDGRLREAARSEGFAVLPESAAARAG